MLKKLLKGCLTAAMVTAMAVSVSAETTTSWSGNVTANLKSSTVKANTTGAKAITEMNMNSSGDIDFVASVTGDQWTGTAYADLDWSASAVSVDDLYVKMSNDTLAISFGEFDPVGVGQGDNYAADIDSTYGAGAQWIPNEQGWLMVSLTEVGLDIILGMNEASASYTAFKSTDTTVGFDALAGDATADGEYASTAYGVKFTKTFSIIDLGFQYMTMGTTINKDDGDDSPAKDTFDGASATMMALAVTANFTEMMGLTFNYDAESVTPGNSGAKTATVTTMEFVFDMGLSDTMGLTAAYGTYAFDTGSSGKGNKYAGSNILLSFMVKTGAVAHYIAYDKQDLKSDANGAKAAENTVMGYSMKVSF